MNAMSHQCVDLFEIHWKTLSYVAVILFRLTKLIVICVWMTETSFSESVLSHDVHNFSSSNLSSFQKAGSNMPLCCTVSDYEDF